MSLASHRLRASDLTPANQDLRVQTEAGNLARQGCLHNLDMMRRDASFTFNSFIFRYATKVLMMRYDWLAEIR